MKRSDSKGYMVLKFTKYQGAGNDFVMIDNRSGSWNELSISQIQLLCDRKFGIGADGLIKINATKDVDFEVDYYNSDGSKSFCGNGARCAVQFARELGIQKEEVFFTAIDGLHSAKMIGEDVDLEMNPVTRIHTIDTDFELYTGSPHFIRFSAEIQSQNMFELGRSIRYSQSYATEGINVNLVEVIEDNQLAIRTYERGVEDETFACGTGVTAAALAYIFNSEKMGEQEVEVTAIGGHLKVKMNRVGVMQFESIRLIGPAVHVFQGETNV